MDRRTYLKHSVALSGGLLIPAGVMSLVGRPGTASSTDLVGFEGKIMGTSYSIKLGSLLEMPGKSDQPGDRLALLSDQQLNRISHRVHTTLQDIDRRMSTWRNTSELSLFNNSTDKEWHKVSSTTLGVIDNSLQIRDLSDGAFDVSVGPLVDLWGFGASENYALSASGFSKPSVKAVAECKQYVGYNTIEVDHSQGVIRKAIPQAQLDLSGIAKGFAVDKVAECLDSHGLDHYLIEVGGELRSKGYRSKNREWKVAIEKPDSARRDVMRALNLKNRAIATSGDYRNFYLHGSERYSHSIDPRKGYPVNHELVSVSVIAETTMLADALSTALIIMGPDAAHAFAEQHKVAVHFILKSATGKLDEQYSSSFTDFIT